MSLFCITSPLSPSSLEQLTEFTITSLTLLFSLCHMPGHCLQTHGGLYVIVIELYVISSKKHAIRV